MGRNSLPVLFDEAPAKKSALVDLLDAIRPYKELIVIVFGVIGGGVAVKEYIATKEEVKILTCQAQYGREMLENRMAMQQAKSEMNEYDQKLHPFEVDSKAVGNQNVSTRANLDLAKEDFKKARDAENNARNILISNQCPEMVRNKEFK